jgi:hypothetical protein
LTAGAEKINLSLASDRTQVGVVGNLSRLCIDWKVVLKLIDKYSTVDFNFIGSYEKSNLSKNNIASPVLMELEKANNVKLMGQMNSESLPSYLTQFDILLCAYKIETDVDIAQHSNLHKIMEYLGSGKVVVTSYVDEYKRNSDLLMMSKPYETIESCFDETILNLEDLNTLDSRKMRQSFAESHSYYNQLMKIESATLMVLNK